MIRIAAAFFLSFAAAPLAAAQGLDCARAPRDAAERVVCADPGLSALQKEATRLAGLARAGGRLAPVRKKEVAESEASLRKTLVACRNARPCLQRALVEQIHRLRQAYPEARSKDEEGVSLGPFVASCPGLDARLSATFVNVDPALAFLSWRFKSVVLTRAPSASGARYTGKLGPGEAQFWNKGKEATLDLPGRPSFVCEMHEPG